MQDFLNELSDDLNYIKHTIEKDTCHIYCESKNIKNEPVHARQERTVRDLPFGDKQVILHIISKRFYKDNGKTYAEKFDFINNTGRRTKRLDKKIIDSNVEGSIIGTERTLKKLGINVSDTTILRIIKKNEIHKKIKNKRSSNR